MGKLTPAQIQKIKEQIKVGQNKIHANKQKYDAFIKDINYKIKVKGHDMEDCDARIRDLKNWLKSGKITEAQFNKKEEVFKNKKSKHRAALYSLEQRKATKTREYQNTQTQNEKKLKDLQNKLKG